MDEYQDKILASLPHGFGAVVIGASGGIGSGICDLLGEQSHIGSLHPLSRTKNGIDLTDEASIKDAAEALKDRPFQLLICATGVLEIDGHSPEKSLRQIDPDIMMRQFGINAIGPALIAKHMLPLMDRKTRSLVAFLSARVGSIGDNRLGGWISYRSSKAALNQIVKTASIEYARTHPEMVLTAIHPGTVRTKLSDPYSSGHPTVSAQDAAISILSTLDGLTPDRSGSFIAYDGSAIPW